MEYDMDEEFMRFRHFLESINDADEYLARKDFNLKEIDKELTEEERLALRKSIEAMRTLIYEFDCR